MNLIQTGEIIYKKIVKKDNWFLNTFTSFIAWITTPLRAANNSSNFLNPQILIFF